MNLASRLEGITKAFGADIILDEATTSALKQSKQNEFRLRRLATVRPSGMNIPVAVSELLSPIDSVNRNVLTDQQVIDFEAGLDDFQTGNWKDADDRLQALPAWDGPRNALLDTIQKHNRIPPENWDGVIDAPKH